MSSNLIRGLIAATALAAAGSAFAQAASGVVISQFAVRGPAGGNDEFVEIFNTSAAPIAIGGWTLQGCANGTPGAPSIRTTVPAGTTLLAGQYYLFANTAASGYSLGVAPDATYVTGFTDFSAAGFSGIRLVANNSVVATAPFVDAVGGQNSPCHEGTGIVTPTVTGVNTAYLRRLVGGVVQDANNNAVDFPGPAAPGTPRNSTTIIGGPGVVLPTVSLAVAPTSFSESGGSASVTATLSAAYTAPVTVELLLSGTASNGADYTISSVSLTIPTGDLSASATVTAIDDLVFEGDETIVTSLGALTNATAGSPNTVTATILENDPSPPPVVGARIYQVQGATHRSPMVNQIVTNVPGIVTARAANGFYMQDGDGDGIDATSDGIFVFTSTAPPAVAAVGSQVLVTGTVQEFRPGNDAENLTVTQISGTPTITPYVGSDLFVNTLVAPTVLGSGGRIPPADIIDNDSLGNVETSATGVFDPAEDGIDFFETLEGMLVRVNGTRATGPRNNFGEVWVVGDLGLNATGANARGGVTLVERSTGVDYNPERIQLDDGLNGVVMPQGINVGDNLGDVTGVVSYSFDNFEVLLTAAPTVTFNALPTTTRTIAFGGDRLSVAAYNVENLDPSDNTFTAFGNQIANVLGAPDILALSEVQDNNGATNNGIVSASQTIQLLIDAIVAAGGPRYSFATVDPVNNSDGGEPGGNIRLVQFYNPLRVSFVPGTNGAGAALDATAPVLVGGRVALTLSPGRVEPTNAFWNSSRKPLAVTYDFNGRRVVIVNNHYNSKGGDQPLFGVNQPPILGSEVQRIGQATLTNNFVNAIQSLDPAARVIVLGDLNDFDFSPPLRVLRTGADGTRDTLRNLGTELISDPAERYSYVFEGNSQELDHILATPSLLAADAQYEALRLNAEYATQLSDHEPLLSSYLIPANVAPTAVAVATPSQAISGNTVTLDGSASIDSDGSIVSYAWVQTAGPAVTLATPGAPTTTFTAPFVTAPATLSFSLTVFDNEGLSDVETVSVTVNPNIDTTPLPFNFAAQLNVPFGTQIVSNSIVVLGINAPAAITVTGGQYSINGGAFTALVGAVVNNGDAVRVRVLSSLNGATTTSATLTIDTVSATFSVTTVAADTTPNAFSFGSVDGVLRNTVQTSAPVTISGINVATPISVSGGEYSVNGSAFKSVPGVVLNGDNVRVRGIASNRFNTTTTVTVTIGDVSGSYAITTRRLLEPLFPNN